MMRKLLNILILITLAGTLSPVFYVEAQPPTPPATPGTEYKLLAPLPNPNNSGTLEEYFNPADPTGAALGKYLNMMIKLIIGISAVLAVVMIVIGGMEYMTSELISSKEAGKKKIQEALLGLLIALGAWALLNTINPDLLNTNVTIGQATITVTQIPVAQQVAGRLGQSRAQCTPVTNPSSPCTLSNLANSGFANTTQASSICNGESGGVANAASGSDMCRDGNSFSFGLFQVNVIAHANAIPGGVCSGVIQTNGSGTQGTCLQQQNGICVRYDCTVTNQSKYQSCISYITNPANNISFARNLQAARGWDQWGFNNSCGFP